MSISVVLRPPLFCAACGSAMQVAQIGAIQREVWCNNAACPQYGEHGTFDDPVMTHMSRGAIVSLMTMNDLNPQPQGH